jgi:hypothetical protein
VIYYLIKFYEICGYISKFWCVMAIFPMLFTFAIFYPFTFGINKFEVFKLFVIDVWFSKLMEDGAFLECWSVWWKAPPLCPWP